MKTILQTIALIFLFLSYNAYAQRCSPNDTREWCRELNRRGEAINAAGFAEALRQAAERQKNEAQQARNAEQAKAAREAARPWYLQFYTARDLDVWDSIKVSQLSAREIIAAWTNADMDFNYYTNGVLHDNFSYRNERNILRINALENPNFPVFDGEGEPFYFANSADSSLRIYFGSLRHFGDWNYLESRSSNLTLNEIYPITNISCKRIPDINISRTREEWQAESAFNYYRKKGIVIHSSYHPIDKMEIQFNSQVKLAPDVHDEYVKALQCSILDIEGNSTPYTDGLYILGDDTLLMSNSSIVHFASSVPYSISCSANICYTTQTGHVLGKIERYFSNWLETTCHIREDDAIKCEFEED